MINNKDIIEVSDGTLKQKSYKEPFNGKPYIGSLIKTRNTGNESPNFIFQYGYVEVKLRRLVVGEGFHMNAYTYAFDSTTLSSSKHGGHVWPSEIDYAETLSRAYYRRQILNALHTEAGDDEHWNRGIDGEDWNIYGFEWKENGKVDFYINNKLVYQSKELLRSDLPHYLVLRIGVGGWIGEPDENTEFPAIQEVDWIRVYKKK